jgi:hypothetical protein
VRYLIKIAIAGNTTADAFERQARTNKTYERASQKYFFTLLFKYLYHEIRPDKKNKLLKTSFLAEIQATDSTCIGCTANKAATKNARIKFLVNRKYISVKTRIVFSACRMIFPMIKGFGDIPSGQLLQVLSFRLRLRIVSG